MGTVTGCGTLQLAMPTAAVAVVLYFENAAAIYLLSISDEIVGKLAVLQPVSRTKSCLYVGRIKNTKLWLLKLSELSCDRVACNDP